MCWDVTWTVHADRTGQKQGNDLIRKAALQARSTTPAAQVRATPVSRQGNAAQAPAQQAGLSRAATPVQVSTSLPPCDLNPDLHDMVLRIGAMCWDVTWVLHADATGGK